MFSLRNFVARIVALFVMSMAIIEAAPAHSYGSALRVAYPNTWASKQASGPIADAKRWLIQMATVCTNAGLDWVVDNLDATVSTTGDYIGWGTGAGTAAVGDTILFSEAAEARVVATRTQFSSTTLQWVGTLTCAGSQKTITNAGNFTASSGGSLIVKGDHAGTVCDVGDAIAYTIRLQFTNT